MLRRLPIALLAAVATAVGGGAASAAVAAPTLVATLDQCQTAVQPMDRFAIFRGEMDTVPGTDRMWLRFDLFVRAKGELTFKPVVAPGLGDWTKSTPGYGRFVYRKQVANLAAPAEYRAHVRFRWYDASGHLLLSASRRTPTCRQPDQRPDLALGALTTQAAPQPDLLRYVVAVRNDGRGDAGPFGVTLRVGTDDRPALTVTGLAAGAGQTVTFVAPRCVHGQQLRVVVDPDGRVDESDERNDALTVDCPL